MFSIFKIFIIFLNIILSTCARIVLVDEWGYELSISSTTTVFEYSDVMIPLKYHEKVISEKDRIISEKDQKIGKLDAQLNAADKYRLLLGLTYRIDYLESLLAPGSDFKGKQRRVRWLTIFSLKTPAVEKIKKKVEDAGMTELAFAECIEKLCNERNTRAGHARISLPKIVSEKTIEEALAIMEIAEDKRVVDTVKIIVAPVEASDLTTTTTTQKS